MGWEIGTCLGSGIAKHEGHLSSATLSYARAVSAVFDEPNLVAAAGLVPMVALAEVGGTWPGWLQQHCRCRRTRARTRG